MKGGRVCSQCSGTLTVGSLSVGQIESDAKWQYCKSQNKKQMCKGKLPLFLPPMVVSAAELLLQLETFMLMAAQKSHPEGAVCL